MAEAAVDGGVLALLTLLGSLAAQSEGTASPNCEAKDFAEVQARLGPTGRITVETSTAGTSVTAWQRDEVIWSGHVRSRDCAVIAQVVELGLARTQRAPLDSLPVGDVPSLAESTEVESVPSIQTPPPQLWHVELGAGPHAELEQLRFGGTIDLALRRRGIGGLLELGAYGSVGGPIEDASSEVGTLSFFTVHGLLSVDGCLIDGLPGALRPCAALGGGLEWLDVRAEGDALFRSETQGRVIGRLDAGLRLGWSWGPAGVDGAVRLTWRPNRPRFGVEGATVNAELPEWTIGIGLRGWVRFF